MAKQIWEEILLAMYRSEPKNAEEHVDIQLDWTPDALMRVTGLGYNELTAGLAKLGNWGLVEDEEIKEPSTESDPILKFSLTKDGIELANDRDLSLRQQGTNRAVALFTLTLVLIELVRLAPQIPPLFGVVPVRGLAALLIGFLVAIVIGWTNLLGL